MERKNMAIKMSDIRKNNQKTGYFFSESNKKFFRSIIYPKLYIQGQKIFFITSEQMSGDWELVPGKLWSITPIRRDSDIRTFSVRVTEDEGHTIRTVKNWLNTYEKAVEVINQIRKGEQGNDN